ncbi:MAG: hypothetical protein EZS28_017295 [Streblomastix strix]|uniref:Uncharacterized protein n=1 Tax=Streblomastix strix TaxID=222440 RepID=A0A5J4VX19_9EUKA|nr:MAG: hypothetical protein EZS28_017295 [Streblomastix strix]
MIIEQRKGLGYGRAARGRGSLAFLCQKCKVYYDTRENVVQSLCNGNTKVVVNEACHIDLESNSSSQTNFRSFDPSEDIEQWIELILTKAATMRVFGLKHGVPRSKPNSTIVATQNHVLEMSDTPNKMLGGKRKLDQIHNANQFAQLDKLIFKKLITSAPSIAIVNTHQ